MFLRSTAGDYEPSFFIIRIDSDEPLKSDLPKFIEKNLSTFIHEYIHFLQDITLPYCIRENLALLNEFFLLVDQATNDLREIHIPSHLTDEDIDVTKRQTELTWGSGDIKDNTGPIQEIKFTYETFEGLDFKVYKYVIFTENVSDYHLGARDLLEYLAHKIESRHFPEEENLPDLPYRSVDLVLDYYKLSYLSDQKRVALAEYCLLNDNPVRRLMVVIDDLGKGVFGGADLTDEQFIERLRRYNWKACGVPYETIGAKVHRRIGQLKQLLLSKFPKKSFLAIHDWLDNIMEYALNDLAGQQLFARLYGLGTEGFFNEIREVINKVGIPLLVNNNNEIGTSLGNDETKNQFIQLLLAFEFSRYVKRDNPTCPLCDVCERHYSDIMDDDCIEGPSRRALDDKPCFFGEFIKAHGLSHDEIKWLINGEILSGQRSRSCF